MLLHKHMANHTIQRYRIMQIVRGGSIAKVFQWIFFIIRCFELLYNRKSFPVNNKIMQPQNFSTANDLHYMVFCDNCGFNLYASQNILTVICNYTVYYNVVACVETHSNLMFNYYNNIIYYIKVETFTNTYIQTALSVLLWTVK